MDIFETINQRHSYRGSFTDQPVPRKDLKRIVQAGLQAPSGKNAQTTEFVVVDDLSLLQQICTMPGANKALQQARALIVSIVDMQPETIYHGHAFQLEDCAAAVQNMLLAVTALGYATVWIDGWLRLDNRAEKIGRLLNLPQEKLARVVLPIGVPENRCLQKEKKSFEKRAWFNAYADKTS